MSSIAIDSRPIFIRFFLSIPSPSLFFHLLSTRFPSIRGIYGPRSRSATRSSSLERNSRTVNFADVSSVSWSKGIIIAMAFLLFFSSPSLSFFLRLRIKRAISRGPSNQTVYVISSSLNRHFSPPAFEGFRSPR